MALVLTFAVSGITHSLVLCHAAQSQFSWKLCFFFVACSCVVLLEQMVKQWLKRLRLYTRVVCLIPKLVRAIYTLAVLFYLSHLFFWPALHDAGMVSVFVDGLFNAFKTTP